MKEGIQNFSREAVERFRKKGQERLTIMVIPHGQDRVFSLQLNWYLILFCSAMLGLLVFLSFYGIYESRLRQKDWERLNRVYGRNFQAVLSLEEKVEELRRLNQKIRHRLEQTVVYLGAEDKLLDILPDEDLALQKSREILSSTEVANERVQGNFIKFLPPVYHIKALTYQIQGMEPMLKDLQGWFYNGYGIYRHIPMGRPVEMTGGVRDSSAYGPRPDPFQRFRLDFHAGYDMRGPIGRPVHATASGTVFRVLRSLYRGYGNAVVIRHDFGFYSLYAHLSRLHVKQGDAVQKGQLIGELGNTGRSTGPHVHYEVRFPSEHNHIDPLPYICAEDYQTRRCRDYLESEGEI